MSCSCDWKAYMLKELSADDRRAAEAHAATCAACREELATLRLTLDSLSTLRDEEVPRRIAFVSDPVFQSRWWQRFLQPTFAAGCLIAASILVHAYARPAAENPAEMQARIDQAVSKAVSEQTNTMMADYEIIKKQNTLMYINNTGMVRQ